MTAYLRGPSVSYNLTHGGGANFDLGTAEGFFDWTIPADWDNTSTANLLHFSIVGGAVADGTPPDTFDLFTQVTIYTVNGGSGLSAPLSGSGKSWAIGSVVRNWYGYSALSPDWTTIGLNVAATGSVQTTATSNKNGTLVDGVTWGQSGEGFFSVGGLITGPLGWQFDNANISNDGTSAIKLVAGQTVTVGVRLISDVSDSTHPDRLVFGAIQSITLSYKGTDYPIDITTMKVGWSAGASYTLYINGSTTTIYPNPLRTVELTAPPAAHPNAQVYTDFYLMSVSAQRVQGHVF